jgi:hypothetical protein
MRIVAFAVATALLIVPAAAQNNTSPGKSGAAPGQTGNTPGQKQQETPGKTGKDFAPGQQPGAAKDSAPGQQKK